MDTGQQLAELHYLAGPEVFPCAQTGSGWLDLMGARSLDRQNAEGVRRVLRAYSTNPAAIAMISGMGTRHSPSAWTFAFDVQGTERIAVPAGTFDTVVVRVREQGMEPNAFRVEHGVWLDAATGVPIRVRHRVIVGVDTFTDWEATTVAPPAR